LTNKNHTLTQNKSENIHDTCEQQQDNADSTKSRLKPLGLLAIVWSVIAALFGVRDHKKHERDVTEGNLIQFVVVGVIFVFIFVLSLIWIVLRILEELTG